MLEEFAFGNVLTFGAQKRRYGFSFQSELILLRSVVDPWHFGTDLDPDPRIRASDQWIRIRLRILLFLSLTFNTQKNYFSLRFLLITFWRYIHIIFLRSKVIKKSQNSRNQGFSYYFCLMIEGSGSRSIPLTNGSVSGCRRPKNIRNLRIQDRIHNTDITPARSRQTHLTWMWILIPAADSFLSSSGSTSRVNRMDFRLLWWWWRWWSSTLLLLWCCRSSAMLLLGCCCSPDLLLLLCCCPPDLLLCCCSPDLLLLLFCWCSPGLVLCCCSSDRQQVMYTMHVLRNDCVHW